MIEIYSDGDPYNIAWGIRTKQDIMLERRRQAGIYHGAISAMQARFVALHVGLFWGIGVFAIRDGDRIQFMIDDHTMMDCLERHHSADKFINGRIHHIHHLISQRELIVSTRYIEHHKNVASHILDTDATRFSSQTMHS